MISIGATVRILDKLPESANNYSKHVVHDRRGMVCVVDQKEESTVCPGEINWWVKSLDDQSLRFWVRSEWVELYKNNSSINQCTCSIVALMTSGCKCGQIERERNAK